MPSKLRQQRDNKREERILGNDNEKRRVAEELSKHEFFLTLQEVKNQLSTKSRQKELDIVGGFPKLIREAYHLRDGEDISIIYREPIVVPWVIRLDCLCREILLLLQLRVLRESLFQNPDLLLHQYLIRERAVGPAGEMQD